MNRRDALRLAAIGPVAAASLGWDSLGRRRQRKAQENRFVASFYPPSSDATVAVAFTANPSNVGNFWRNIDEPYAAFDDTNYIEIDFGLGPGGTLSAIFGIDYPGYFDQPFYNDATTGIRPGVSEIGVAFRSWITSDSVTVAAIATRAGFADQTSAATVVINSPTPRAHLISFGSLDPFTGAAWTVANLITTSFGLIVTVSPGSGIWRTSFLAVYAIETDYRGGDRARLHGRGQSEDAFHCTICSRPFSRSDLIRVSLPLHPNYGQLVCQDDYDISVEVEEDAMRGTAPREGDIDEGEE